MSAGSTGDHTGPSRPASEVEVLARQATRMIDPEGGLRALTALRERLVQLESLHVSNALGAGRSWGDIAKAVGISRQAAHKRYSRRVRAAEQGPQESQRKVMVTSEARRAVRLSRDEAHAAGVSVVGTEHLLLGILRCDGSSATSALAGAGVRLDEARAAAQPTLVGVPAPDDVADQATAWRGLTPHARRVLERSLDEALQRSEGYIGVEHLLLAVLRDQRGGAAQTLERLEVDRADVRSRLAQW